MSVGGDEEEKEREGDLQAVVRYCGVTSFLVLHVGSREIRIRRDGGGYMIYKDRIFRCLVRNSVMGGQEVNEPLESDFPDQRPRIASPRLI